MCIRDSIILEIRVKGHKKPYNISWAKGFRKVAEVSGKSEMTSDRDCISLVLKNIDPSDAGVYKCTVKSSAGTSEVKFSPIKVKKPDVEETPKTDQEDEMKKGLKKTGPREDKAPEVGLGKMKLKKGVRDIKKDDGFEVKEQLKPAVVESGDSAKFSVKLSKKPESFVWSFNEQEIVETSEEFTTTCKDDELRYSTVSYTHLTLPTILRV